MFAIFSGERRKVERSSVHKTTNNSIWLVTKIVKAALQAILVNFVYPTMNLDLINIANTQKNWLNRGSIALCFRLVFV